MAESAKPDTPPQRPALTRPVMLAVLVAALGYFVDIYDLLLFSVVRKASLESLGIVGDEALKSNGVYLINCQMGGMLVGGVLWGILGDKRGRLSVLFGSILLYSLANIANGLVQTVDQYAVLRFIAGVGLAGELGAGITLVSELMSKTSRGYGTTIVAGTGIMGAVLAVFVSREVTWRTSYFIGGAMGLALLLLRIGVAESGMFETTKKTDVARGNFFQLFQSSARLKRYLCLILSGVPIWYAVGILITFSPELGAKLGVSPTPIAGDAVALMYAGLAAGDLLSGFASQIVKSRKKVVAAFILLCGVCTGLYFTVGATSRVAFYTVCVLLGIANGYWAVFVTMASEQFGTNLRATVTTSAPNFVRGAVVILTTAFTLLDPHLGIVGSAIAVGVGALTIALLSLTQLEETYGKDLDYVER